MSLHWSLLCQADSHAVWIFDIPFTATCFASSCHFCEQWKYLKTKSNNSKDGNNSKHKSLITQVITVFSWSVKACFIYKMNLFSVSLYFTRIPWVFNSKVDDFNVSYKNQKFQLLILKCPSPLNNIVNRKIVWMLMSLYKFKIFFRVMIYVDDTIIFYVAPGNRQTYKRISSRLSWNKVHSYLFYLFFLLNLCNFICEKDSLYFLSLW